MARDVWLPAAVGAAILHAADTHLVFSSDTTYSGTVAGGVPRLEMDVTSCAAVFAGTWDGWGNGGTKSYWSLDGGASLLITGDAHINNNDETLVNARPFFIEGAGPDNVVEFAPEFSADHMGYPDQWTNDGLSTLRVGGVTYVTHAGANLPTVHKKAYEGSHTHHGLLVFTGAPSVWQVRTAAQRYDGGVTWDVDWTLVAEQDLTIEGEYTDHAKICFGTDGDSGATLVKRGPAALIVAMTPGHGPGSRIVVERGLVRFTVDQGDPTQLQLDSPYRSTNAGQYLELDIGVDGAVWFSADTNGIRRLGSEGAMRLRSGAELDVLDSAVFAPSSDLRLGAAGSLPHITVHGDAHLAGAILVDSCTVAAGVYEIAHVSGTLDGAFDDAGLPDGMTLRQEAHRVLLEVTGAVSIRHGAPLHVASPRRLPATVLNAVRPFGSTAGLFSLSGRQMWPGPGTNGRGAWAIFAGSTQ